MQITCKQTKTVKQTSDAKKVYRPLSRGGHFLSGDLKSFVYARLAS